MERSKSAAGVLLLRTSRSIVRAIKCATTSATRDHPRNTACSNNCTIFLSWDCTFALPAIGFVAPRCFTYSSGFRHGSIGPIRLAICMDSGLDNGYPDDAEPMTGECIHRLSSMMSTGRRISRISGILANCGHCGPRLVGRTLGISFL